MTKATVTVTRNELCCQIMFNVTKCFSTNIIAFAWAQVHLQRWYLNIMFEVLCNRIMLYRSFIFRIILIYNSKQERSLSISYTATCLSSIISSQNKMLSKIFKITLEHVPNKAYISVSFLSSFCLSYCEFHNKIEFWTTEIQEYN